MGQHLETCVVGGLHNRPQLPVGELDAIGVRARRQHAAAGHHLDDVHPALDVLGDGATYAVDPGRLPAQVVAVPARFGDRRPRSNHPRQSVQGPGSEGAVVPVSQVAHRGHPACRLGGQAGADPGIQLVVGHRARLFEAAHHRGGDEVDVTVEQPGEQRAVVRRDLGAVRQVRVTALHADDRLAVDEHRRGTQEARPVEGLSGPERQHGAQCGPTGSRRVDELVAIRREVPPRRTLVG